MLSVAAPHSLCAGWVLRTSGVRVRDLARCGLEERLKEHLSEGDSKCLVASAASQRLVAACSPQCWIRAVGQLQVLYSRGSNRGGGNTASKSGGGRPKI